MSPAPNDDVPMLDARPALLATIDSLVAERDAALARIAELEALDYVRNVDAEKERDAALAEIERLRDDFAAERDVREHLDGWSIKVEAERDAAHAAYQEAVKHDDYLATELASALSENERLREDLDIANYRGDEWRAKYNADTDTISAWRAKYEALAAEVGRAPEPI